MLRKRQQDSPQTTRRNFVAAVKRELPAIVQNLSGVVDKMDLRPSVIGQALNFFTRYSKVLDADGTVMQPYMASRIIEQEIDTVLAFLYKSDEIEHQGEEDNDHGRES